jgi:aspartate carbamoyltransferase regulatory subunit
VNTTASASANITARPLTVTAITNSKVYDGTTAAIVNFESAVLVGKIDSDNVTLNTESAAGAFDTKNVGTAKVVTVSGLTLSGTDIASYTLIQPEITANITTRPLTVTGISADNKVYDGSTAAVLNFSSAVLAGKVGSDNVMLNTESASGVFDTKNVGTAKAVTISEPNLSGPDAGNYTLVQPEITTNITTRPLTVSASGVNKIYDDNLTATVTLSDNRIAGDILTTAYAVSAFADKNIGNAKLVNVSNISISGTDAANYTFNTTASTTANITVMPIVVSVIGESSWNSKSSWYGWYDWYGWRGWYDWYGWRGLH